jgi:hypothetical protein
MSENFMSSRLAGFLVVISAVSMLGLLLLFAYAPYLRTDDSNDTDVVSRSAVGFAGLKELLSLSRVPTEIDRGPLVRASSRPSLVILTPPAGTSAADVTEYDYSAPTLIILPKWHIEPILEQPHWVSKSGILDDGEVARIVAGLARGVTLINKPGSARNIQTVLEPAAPPGLHPGVLKHIEEIRWIGGPRTVLRAFNYGAILGMVRHKGQPVYILSEPDVMNNQGLADRETARSALAIVSGLRQGSGPVRFDVTLNGLGRDPGLLRAVFEPPLLGATVCAMLAALLIGLHAASRFGSPQRTGRVFARGKTMLAVNTAELLRIMGREGAMAGRYVQAARDLALVRLGARRSSAPEQDELLAILERQSGTDIRYAALVQEGGQAQGSAALLRIARKAYLWRKGITRGY